MSAARSSPTNSPSSTRCCKPGMVFVDVGANDGYYTLFAARRVGPAGRVMAVEPSSRERVNLKRNIARNRLANVTVVPAGAGRGLRHRRPAPRPGRPFRPQHAGQVRPRRRAGGERRAGEGRRTLDEVAGELGLTRVDFIKIDVEGAEASVIAGARDVLRRCGRCMLLEINDEGPAGAGSEAPSAARDAAQRVRLRDPDLLA